MRGCRRRRSGPGRTARCRGRAGRPSARSARTRPMRALNLKPSPESPAAITTRPSAMRVDHEAAVGRVGPRADLRVEDGRVEVDEVADDARRDRRRHLGHRARGRRSSSRQSRSGAVDAELVAASRGGHGVHPGLVAERAVVEARHGVGVGRVADVADLLEHRAELHRDAHRVEQRAGTGTRREHGDVGAELAAVLGAEHDVVVGQCRPRGPPGRRRCCRAPSRTARPARRARRGRAPGRRSPARRRRARRDAARGRSVRRRPGSTTVRGTPSAASASATACAVTSSRQSRPRRRIAVMPLSRSSRSQASTERSARRTRSRSGWLTRHSRVGPDDDMSWEAGP